MPNEKLRTIIKGRYRQQVVAFGLTNSGNLLEILAGPNGETWTLVIVKPDQTACVITDGENWRWLKREEPEA